MDKLEKISVYARVTPENKIRIVDAWQKEKPGDRNDWRWSE